MHSLIFKHSVKHSLKDIAVFAKAGSSESDLKICVFSGEGNIPHLHIIKGKLRSCVKFEKAEYFDHKVHINILRILRKGMPEIVDNMLRQTIGIDNCTAWQIAIHTWNMNNPNKKQLDSNTPQPDYSKLKTTS